MQKSVTTQNLSTATTDEQRELPMPNRKTINIIWIMVVCAFILMTFMFAADLAWLAYKMPNSQGCQYVYTILTTFAGFFIGLFITSPVQPRK